MVTLIVQDSIRVHLYRHMVIMIQDDRSMTEITLHSTTREVTMVTNHITIEGVTKVIGPSTTRAVTKETGHNQKRTLEDLGRVNLSTPLPLDPPPPVRFSLSALISSLISASCCSIFLVFGPA